MVTRNGLGGFIVLVSTMSGWCSGGSTLPAYVAPSVSIGGWNRMCTQRCVRRTGCLSLAANDQSDNAKPRKPLNQATTFVETMGIGSGKSLVEVGCTNAKREFVVDQHLLGLLPERADRDAVLGTITLVGAGPGDPELLTVAAVKAIKSADLVVADRLVSEEILSTVECELKVAQKHPGCAIQAQNEIYRWCVEAALAGRRVVRLKIGDPFVFGRGAEEVLEFRRFGIEPAVIPGISSALAGPMAAGIPVTHRGVANRVVFGTGMGQDETAVDAPAYHPEQTAVFLMAVGRLPELCRDLVEGGYPPDTPVGICERATTPRQRTLYADLSTAADAAAAAGVRAPAIVVVGRVVGVLRPDAAAAADAAAEPAPAAADGAQAAAAEPARRRGGAPKVVRA